jgi:hypothetical protein
MKRPAWQARRIATAKTRSQLPRCEYTEGCEGRAMGALVRPLGDENGKWTLACVKCAADAQRVERIKRAAAPRET